MDGYILALRWLAHAAVGGFIVLVVGSVAAKLCRQPVRRARVVVLTLLVGFAVPWLGILPDTPKWSAGFVLAFRVGGAPSLVRMPTVPPPAGQPGSIELPQGPVALIGGQARPHQHPERSAGQAVDGRRFVGSGLSRLTTLSWDAFALTAYAATSAGLAAWWLLGQVLLFRIAHAARPAPSEVHEWFREIRGREGREVVLLESDTLELPLTFTWIRPVIVLPRALCSGGDSQELRFCLAHEWSHIERRDARAWNLAALAGFVLFYQPLFWWLRRQLRLCQDYLADDRARALASAEDYASYLVRLARGHRTGLTLPALGVSDRHTNLYRRVAMLLQDHEPLEHQCRTLWNLAALVSAAVVLLVASCLRLDAAPSPQKPKPQEEKSAPPEPKDQPTVDVPKTETLRYSGQVKENGTTKPIAGATVVVRRSILKRNDENTILQETRHTTDAHGAYSFTIPPEQVAEGQLYIELDVEHPDYATEAGSGYGLTLIRRDEAKGRQPFFKNISLRPAKPILGRVEAPDGAPVHGVEILAFSRSGKVQPGPLDSGSLARVRTDQDGRFRAPITTPGLGVFWIMPKDFAPQIHEISAEERGELGTFRLKKGMILKGRALGLQGNPLAGLVVEIRHDRDSSPDREILEQLAVSDLMTRRAETDDRGRFTFDPMPAGAYVVQPLEYQNVGGNKGTVRRPWSGVFAPRKVILPEGETPQPIEVRAAPYVVIEGGWIDSKGKPRRGRELLVSGQVDGQTWHTMVHPSAEGKFSVQVPQWIERAQLTIFVGQLTSTRYRVGKDGKLQAGQFVMFGTLDHDVKDLQIVRYEETAVIVKATATVGRPIKDLILAGEYTEEIANARVEFSLPNGAQTEVEFERQADGRFRATKLTPARELTITADADGFKPASRKIKLPEGKTEEITFVLEPK
jgi:beta-lactamase regulating signal transducer with metallopeptidase domain